MNTKRILIGALLVGLATLTGAGCGQEGSVTPLTAPDMMGPEAASLGFDQEALQIDERQSSIPEDLFVTAMIGPEGGMIGAKNLSVEFPRGCLSERTEITLRVRMEEEVLFRIAPVGLRLDRPVKLSFILRPGDDPKTTTFLRYDASLNMLESEVIGRMLVSESDRLGDFLIGPESLDGSKGRAGW